MKVQSEVRGVCAGVCAGAVRELNVPAGAQTHRKLGSLLAWERGKVVLEESSNR